MQMNMFSFLFTCIVAITPQEIQADISRIFGKQTDNRSILYVCNFSMRVFEFDEALSTHYFPVTDIRGKIENNESWEEMVARHGTKYRRDFVINPPKDFERPKSWSGSRLYNGVQSWDYQPEIGMANEYNSVDVGTLPNSDYYGDMIGFPLEKIQLATRSVAGDTNQPFNLDELIPSGKYNLTGEESFEGEACVLIERPGLDRLWLSKKKGWVIVKREWAWTEGGPLKRRITNRDFRAINTGVWFPYKCEMEIYGHPDTLPNKRVGVMTCVVSDVKVGIKDEWFEPFFPKGTKISNVTNRTIHQYGMAKEELDETVGRAMSLGPFRKETWSLHSRILIGLNIFAVLGLAIGVVWHRSKQRRASK